MAGLGYPPNNLGSTGKEDGTLNCNLGLGYIGSVEG